ncbi:hypothetical protein [Brevibacillus nitrificans]|uniref:hypothetical protein n=1 Tax=Brevibacillus nitrificans TaxID=651560 RepID=UPI002860713A|nr:hypothetical protein [Brevibacillus nitrificans]MDR7318892.1 hypothetical protein [Brevibacillus nitrificans]
MGTKPIPNPQEVDDLRKWIASSGLWEVDKIRIHYISDHWVQFSCEKKVCNGPTEFRNVQHTLIDRIKGRSFDEKVEVELQQFVSMLKLRNEEILRLRGKEELLRGMLKEKL